MAAPAPAAPPAAATPTYTLTVEQLDEFSDTCSLYRVSEIAVGNTYEEKWALAYTAVPFFLEYTTEYVYPEPQGGTKETNIFTADHGWFNVQQEMGDRWGVLKTNTPNANGFWIVQGNPQPIQDPDDLTNGDQMAYIVRAVKPGYL